MSTKRLQKRINRTKATANTTIVNRGVFRLPALVCSVGTIEALKWIALLLMMLDHINKYLLHDRVHALFATGRVVMPFFAFVLAFNLARPGTFASGAYLRVIKRLMVFGSIASLPFIALGGLAGGWWPLNILITFAVAVAIMYLVDSGTKLGMIGAICLFVVGGSVVEFWWPALGICLAAWRYCKSPSWASLFFWLFSTIALFVINHDFWALLSLPVIFILPMIQIKLPRYRNFFYVIYPLHLGIIWMVATYG